MTVPLWKRMAAEFVGTFWLVFAGCGSAVLAAKFFATEGSTPINLGIGLAGVSAAFGLTVLTMAYAIGHISGCHLNPAVTLGLCVARKFPNTEVLAYWLAQVGGGLAAAGVLFVIASGKPGFELGGFAANGFGEHSPGGYSLVSALVTEAVMTGLFLLVILGCTDRRAPAGTAPIAIGLCLTLIHLVSIPVTNTSVNPARSTSQAIFVGGWALQQLWLFWLAPLGGAVIAGLVHQLMFASPSLRSQAGSAGVNEPTTTSRLPQMTTAVR